MKRLYELYRPIDRWLATNKKLMAVIIALELPWLWFVLCILPNLKHK